MNLPENSQTQQRQLVLEMSAQGDIAMLTISHSARRNAMTRQMWRDIPSILGQLASSTRCLLIRGDGEHFCAGGDISEYPLFRFDPVQLEHFHEREVAPALEALLALDIPVVAMIAGNCMGGGLEIASCADIRIAGQGARFGAPIAKLGMPMALRELAVVLQAAGQATVREMLLEASILDAAQMHNRGFIQHLVPDAQLLQETQQCLQRLCELSPQAARLNKQALRMLDSPFLPSNQWIAERNTARIAIDNIARPATSSSTSVASLYAYAASAEHVQGIEAFLNKRPPRF